MSENDALPFITDEDFRNTVITNVNAMLDGDLPPEGEQPNWIKVGRSKIVVTQVSSPYKFWFMSTSALSDLNDMMKSLSLTYFNCCNVKEFMIPTNCIKVGLICAAIFHDQWHRAKIVAVIDDKEVIVNYVDYGTTASISRYHLLYLHKNFSDYPAQAMRGCLDLIRPTGGTWMHESCKFFSGICLKRTIYAKITAIDDRNNVLYMNLTQMPKDGERVSLGATLIAKQYAYAVDESICVSDHRIYCEEYPTFDMLECGTFPSIQTINKWKKKGFDFDRYDQSIAPPHKCGISPK